MKISNKLERLDNKLSLAVNFFLDCNEIIKKETNFRKWESNDSSKINQLFLDSPKLGI